MGIYTMAILESKALGYHWPIFSNLAKKGVNAAKNRRPILSLQLFMLATVTYGWGNSYGYMKSVLVTTVIQEEHRIKLLTRSRTTLMTSGSITQHKTGLYWWLCLLQCTAEMTLTKWHFGCFCWNVSAEIWGTSECSLNFRSSSCVSVHSCPP